MTVEIDIVLDADGVEGRLDGIAASLEAVEAAGGSLSDMDFGEIDIGEISGDVGNLVSMVNDLDRQISNLNDTIEKVDGTEIEFKHKKTITSGDTNNSDSTGGDPPGSSDSDSDGFNRRKLAKKIGQASGFGDDVNVVGGYDPEKLNDIAADIEITTQDLTFPKDYDNERAFYPGEKGVENIVNKRNLGGSALKGNFYDEKDPSEMDWGELREKASEAGVYPQHADAETLEENLRKQQFGTDEIIVDTASHGKVRSTQARRIADGQFDVDPRGPAFLKDLETDGITVSAVLDEIGIEQDDLPRLNAEIGPDGKKFSAVLDEMDIDQRELLSFDGREDVEEKSVPFGTSPKRAVSSSGLIPENLEELQQRQRDLLKESGLHPTKVSQISGFDYDNLNREEQARLASASDMDDAAQFGPNGNRRSFDQFTEEQQNKLREAARDQLEDLYSGEDDLTQGRRRKTFVDLNKSIRDSVPETDAEIGRGPAEQDLSGVDHRSVWKRAKDKAEVKDIKDIKKRFDGIGGAARRVFPSMSQINNLMAAAVPIMAVLGSQLLGVAGALGAVGAAGAAVVGLGLLGHGESMQESFGGAKREIKDLKEEIFDAAQPQMQKFAPIQSRAFDAIPGRVRQITSAMDGLVDYEDTLFTLGGMLADGLEHSVEAIVDNEQAISQLAIRFAELGGSAALNFFGWLFEEAKRNQDMLVAMGSSLKDLATIVFRVFKVIVMFLNRFSPLIDMLLVFSRLLNTTVGRALFGFIAASYLTISVLGKLGMAALTAWGILTGPGIKGLVIKKFALMHAHIQSLIAEYTALGNAAFWAQMAMGAIGAISLGVGLLGAGAMVGGMAGGGMSSSGVGNGMGGGGKTVYNDNRQFTVKSGGGGDYATQKSTEDTVRRMGETKSAQELPSLNR